MTFRRSLSIAALLIAFSTVLATTREASERPEMNPAFGKVVAECNAKGTPHVWLFKQWHLAPSTDTKDRTEFSSIHQEKNQTAIFRQIDQWISSKRIREVFAEGCSGEVTGASLLRFNGWGMSDLKKAVNRPDYAEIVSNVPFKLEAKHGDSVRTVCGDDEILIKENNLALSDARGTAGFLLRLRQYKNDPQRAKTYLDGVIQIYKLPANTTVAQAIERLSQELKSAVKTAQEVIDKRTAVLVAQLKKSRESDVAVVFGGLHAEAALRLLEKAGIGCSVIEPVGYQDDEVKLLGQLEEALKKL